jgi:hypothetical protein
MRLGIISDWPFGKPLDALLLPAPSLLEVRLGGNHLLVKDAHDTNPTRLQPVEDDVLALLVPVKA